MSEDAHLKATVHHKGKIYQAGTAASQMGEVANELGDHVWIGGQAPGKVTGEGNPLAGTASGRPQVPTPSALPTPGSRIEAAGEGDGGEDAAADDAGEGGGEGGSARTGRGSRSRSSGSS